MSAKLFVIFEIQQVYDEYSWCGHVKIKQKKKVHKYYCTTQNQLLHHICYIIYNNNIICILLYIFTPIPQLWLTNDVRVYQCGSISLVTHCVYIHTYI